MKFERDEIVGIGVSIAVAVLFFVGLRFDSISSFLAGESTPETRTGTDIVMIDSTKTADLMRMLRGALTDKGVVTKLIIEDTQIGTGTPARKGSHVSVHYIGMLQDGTQFDNSFEKGEPFRFVVGAGSVIKGWDEALVGMKEGGERIIVVPPALAYGDRAVGPVPAHATLLFSIQLLDVE